MTRKPQVDVITEPDPPRRTCFRCGNLASCRALGPNGEQCCFNCVTDDELRARAERLLGRPN